MCYGTELASTAILKTGLRLSRSALPCARQSTSYYALRRWCSVISGGQLKRTGKAEVPNPTEV
jgi:hypothetical protein